jgi:hypothetical protein
VSDGYSGPATLTVDGRRVPVHAVLDARHEPHDGRLHWFGRLRAIPDPAADATKETGMATDRLGGVPVGAEVVLDAGAGPVAARLGDVDPWGRVRVTGVGGPPYPTPPPP